MGGIVLGDLEDHPGDELAALRAGRPTSTWPRGRWSAPRSRPTRCRWPSTSCRWWRCWAASPRGETVVRGAGELRLKESDRITAVVEGLRGLGADIEATADGFAVTGRGGAARRRAGRPRRPPAGDARRRRGPGLAGGRRGRRYGGGRRCPTLASPTISPDCSRRPRGPARHGRPPLTSQPTRHAVRRARRRAPTAVRARRAGASSRRPTAAARRRSPSRRCCRTRRRKTFWAVLAGLLALNVALRGHHGRPREVHARALRAVLRRPGAGGQRRGDLVGGPRRSRAA